MLEILFGVAVIYLIQKLLGLEQNELSSRHNLHQLINTPTHIFQNSESCIDLVLIFYLHNKPNLISETGVYASLFRVIVRYLYKHFLSTYL